MEDESSSAISLTSSNSSSENDSDIDSKLNDKKVLKHIQVKYKTLSSTLKETGNYLRSINDVIYELKGSENQKSDTINQLKGDLESALQRIHSRSDIISPIENLPQSSLCNEDSKSANFPNSIETLLTESKPVNDKRVDDTKELQSKLKHAQRKYSELHSRAQGIISNWKRKCCKLERELKRQKKLNIELQSSVDENASSKSKMMDKIEEMQLKLQSFEFQEKNILDLRYQISSISSQHDNFVREVEFLKDSLEQEKTMVERLSTEKEELKGKNLTNDSELKTIEMENQKFKDRVQKLQEENSLLIEKNLNIEKTLAANRTDLEQMRTSLEMENQKVKLIENERIGIESEYQKIFEKINRQLDTTIRHMSRHSNYDLQAMSSNPAIKDVRLNIVECTSKLNWMFEEIQILCGSRKFFPFDRNKESNSSGNGKDEKPRTDVLDD